MSVKITVKNRFRIVFRPFFMFVISRYGSALLCQKAEQSRIFVV
jgi:hypothetical protein